MKTKVICFFYNEAFLLPFFLNHYRWADELHAVVSRSPDNTGELLVQAALGGRRITVEPYEFPDGMDDFLKRDKVNEILGREHAADWLLVVDADEFIWPSFFTGNLEELQHLNTLAADHLTFVAGYLSSVPTGQDVLVARMWNVFRHETDGELDPAAEPVLQRRHGDPVRDPMYCKPVVIRANRGVRLELGNHQLATRHNVSATHFFDGAHWQNADPVFAVQRRIRDRRDRQSRNNLICGLGRQHHGITEAEAAALCAAHRQDPQLF